MKRFKSVEATRRAYHRDAALNSVHRSSLAVPEIEGAEVEISFLNHFLVKRGYENVACRVTAVDDGGQRIESRLHPVTEKRVYTIPLSGMAERQAVTYLVEFFAADNLFIPFPAVMVNHRGDGFLNTVHAYNRILNDVFEDDAINATPVREASIDLTVDDETDTFAVLTTGQTPCAGTVEVEVVTEARIHRAAVKVDLPRFANLVVSVREALPDLPAGARGVLRITQPKQFMFYGRMLVGLRRADGAFSGNHSYYDSSGTPEYWDDARPSARHYPFFAGFENRVRMYPIMSPGTLALTIVAHGSDGAPLADFPAGELTSPGARFLDASVNALAAEAGLDPAAIAGFTVRAEAEAGRMPTRVNHQLVQESGGLPASVNVSLHNPNVYAPEGRTGFCWGQVPVAAGIDSRLGIVGGVPGGPGGKVEAVFYGGAGEIARRAWELPADGAIEIAPAVELASELDGRDADEYRNVWYVLTAKRPHLSAYAVSRHAESGHCSGEHSY